MVDFSRRSVEAGAAGIFYAISGYAGKGVMPEAVYREMVLPHDVWVLERMPAEAWFNVVHLCGSNLNFGLARDLPVHAVSWSIHNQGNPSLAEGRDIAGKPVMGGLGQRASLLYGPPAEVEAEARARDRGDGRARPASGSGVLRPSTRQGRQPGGDGVGDRGVTRVTGLAEIVLWVHDMEAALHFYRGLFGLELISPPELPNKFLRAGIAAEGVPAMIVLSRTQINPTSSHARRQNGCCTTSHFASSPRHTRTCSRPSRRRQSRCGQASTRS